MTPLPLTLRYCEQPQRDAVAWLVPGDDAAAWLKEWQRWDVKLSDCSAIPVAGLGALTLLPEGVGPRDVLTALPIGRIGPRLYLPTHAKLLPEVEADEVDALLPSWVVAALFYPSAGFFLFESSERLTIAQLLRPPRQQRSDWSRAQPGEAWNTRLHSVQPATLPDLQAILRSGQDDIGSQGNSLRELPPRPGEPGNGLIDQAMRGVRRSISSLAAGMARAVGGGASGTNAGPGSAAGASGARWLGGLAAWASERFQRVTREIEELRHRELLRLMHMLEKNPDEGLKYAIRLGDTGGARGLAPPSGWLAAHGLNFSLGGLGGGHAADCWNVSWQHQQQLRNRYRELALRELQLGRHRRAAYIFAELLSDLESAAGALRSGGHYREAAVLYQQRLGKPLAAAECLEQARLYHEALRIYREQGRHEKVGDLYDLLGEHEEAAAAWRIAAEGHLSGQDYLAAARLFEQKLHAEDEALAALDAGWPASAQAGHCLSEALALLGRRGRHGEARERIGALQSAELGPIWASAAAQTLASLVRSYPDAATGQTAAGAVRVIAARHLKQTVGARQAVFVQAVEDTAPDDRLLRRDCRRFLRIDRTARRSSPLVKSIRGPAAGKSPQLVGAFRLPFGALASVPVVASHHDYLLAAAIPEGGYLPTILRMTWEGVSQPAKVIGRPGELGHCTLLHSIVVDPRSDGLALLGVAWGSTSLSCHFPLHASFHTPAHLLPYAPATGEENLLGLSCVNRQLRVAMRTAAGQVRLDTLAIDRSGRQMDLQDSIELDAPISGESAPLCSTADHTAIGCGNELWIVQHDGNRREVVELPHAITQITCSGPFARGRLIASTEHGAFMLWLDEAKSRRPLQHIAEDLVSPQVCLTRNGWVIAAAATGGEIYGTRDGNLRLAANLPPLRVPPLAVLSTADGDQFAIVEASLAVRVYEMGR